MKGRKIGEAQRAGAINVLPHLTFRFKPSYLSFHLEYAELVTRHKYSPQSERY